MPAFLSRPAAASLRNRPSWAPGSWAWAPLFVTALGCSFPDYDFSADAGAAGAGMPNGGVAGAGLPGSSGASGSSGAAETAGASGTAGSLGAAGAGGQPEGDAGSAGAESGCVVALPSALPASCSNGARDNDETGVDCGGSFCHPCFHTEACHAASDCISAECKADSTCAAQFLLETEPLVTARSTYTLQFRFRLHYLETKPLKLSSVVLRYYFARGDAAEPVVPYATQAFLNSTTSLMNETRWDVVRELAAPPELSDAYVQVSFSGGKTLLQGDSLEITQSVQAGNAPSRPFDQLTHYSFASGTSYAPNERATVYQDGVLAWGTPPAFSPSAGCFYEAFNFAGDAQTVGGLDFLAGNDARVQFSGDELSLSSTPFPSPTGDYLSMLQTAAVLDVQRAILSVPNGSYWLYPYVISADGDNQADLLVQGSPLVTFAAGTINAIPAWARLGPLSVTVTNGKLDLASSGGALRLAGAELYRAAQ